jgi:hypothetical protein
MSVLEALAVAMDREFYTDFRPLPTGGMEVWAVNEEMEELPPVHLATLHESNGSLTEIEVMGHRPMNYDLPRVLLHILWRTSYGADQLLNMTRRHVGVLDELDFVVDHGFSMVCHYKGCLEDPEECAHGESVENREVILRLMFDSRQGIISLR